MTTHDDGGRAADKTLLDKMAMTCAVCGTTDDLRVCPIMTGDKFGEPPKHPVCSECIGVWYDSGITDRDELRAEVERRRRDAGDGV